MTEIELREIGDRFGDYVEFVTRDIERRTEYRYDMNIALTDKWKEILDDWRKTCETCIHRNKDWHELPCDDCTMGGETNYYEPDMSLFMNEPIELKPPCTDKTIVMDKKVWNEMDRSCNMEDCDQYEDGKCTYDNH